MPYSIDYFHPKVKEEIESWPVGILADFARLADLLIEFGPSLRRIRAPWAAGLLN